MRARNARSRRKGKFRTSLTTITAFLVLLMALFAAVTLRILRNMHGQSARTQATFTVAQKGSEILAYLSDQAESADWKELSRQVLALHCVEEGLQYVSVSRDGVIVFHEQTRGLAIDNTASDPDTGELPADISMRRQLLDLGGEEVPVVVFNRQLWGGDGVPLEVEIAMRKETVEREQRAATTAIGSMFQLSLITVIVSFSTCALLVVWMMRREVQRERQRREEEHLAFAGVMANGIVHDFRNPMSAMQLDVQMLNREVARGKECRHERVRELAERVENTVERMDKVFQEFLYMSKPPSDERDAVDLGACIRECVDLLAPRLEQADVSIDLDVPPQPVLVLAYLSGLQRALMNVIINAEQASKTGDQVRIRVLKSGRVATVDVIDSGPGVPAAQRKQIFEMFTTNRPGGTGLGLFLAKTAIERCGGSIKVADAGTGGSRFQITLPLAG